MIGMWFVAFIILLFFEIITVNLVTIWFAIGALVSCVVAYFCDNIFIQIGVFLLTSIIVLVCTKPLSQKIRKGKKVATNSDRVIGMEGVVTMDISKNNVGEVKVDGILDNLFLVILGEPLLEQTRLVVPVPRDSDGNVPAGCPGW